MALPPLLTYLRPDSFINTTPSLLLYSLYLHFHCDSIHHIVIHTILAPSPDESDARVRLVNDNIRLTPCSIPCLPFANVTFLSCIPYTTLFTACLFFHLLFIVIIPSSSKKYSSSSQPCLATTHLSSLSRQNHGKSKVSPSLHPSIHPSFIVVGDGYTLQLFLCSRYKDTEFPSIILCWCQVIPVMQVMIKAVGDKFTCLNAGTVICHPAIA